MLGRPSSCGSQPCCSSISGRRCSDLGVSQDSWTPEDPFDDIPFEPDPRDHSSLGHGFGLGLLGSPHSCVLNDF